jgi:hypothetical protein
MGDLGVWEGVAMDSLKYHFSLVLYVWPFSLCGWPPLKRLVGRFRGGFLQGKRLVAVFYLLGYPTLYAYAREMGMMGIVRIKRIQLYSKINIFCQEICQAGCGRGIRDRWEERKGSDSENILIFLTMNVTNTFQIII